jgi:hypothetical protein
VVLAALLHALKNPGEPFYQVAQYFLQYRLLAVPAAAGVPSEQSSQDGGAADGGVAGPPNGVPGSNAGCSGDGMDLGEGSKAADGQSSTRGGQQQQQQQQQEPLAGRVLGALSPREQGWVRAHIERWTQGGLLRAAGSLAAC